MTRAIVLAHGTPPTREGLDRGWPGWHEGVGYVVAADGGLRLAEPLGLTIDLWVGDADSVFPDELERLRAEGVATRIARRDKDESDTELAVIEAARVADDVTILGGIGGRRLDHTIANIGLLGHPVARGRAIRLLHDDVRVRLVDAAAAAVTCELRGAVGDLVSLFPAGPQVDGITTAGLRYPLRDEPLVAGPARGLSNVRTEPVATVTVRGGRLLVVESPATLSE